MTVDPNPTNVKPPPRTGFLGFLTTLPGILTAVAGLITAAGGVYWAHSGADHPDPTPTVITIQPAPVPDDPAQVDPSGVASEVGSTSVDDQTATLIDDCAQGSPTACQTLLDTLVADCHAGDPVACDVVYEVSATGSDYEDYGATCGGRFDDWEYADQCSQL